MNRTKKNVRWANIVWISPVVSFNPVSKVFHSPLACLSEVFLASGIGPFPPTLSLIHFQNDLLTFLVTRKAALPLCFSEAFSFSIAHRWMNMDTMIDISNCFSLTFQTCLLYMHVWTLLRMRNCQSMASTGNKFVSYTPTRAICGLQEPRLQTYGPWARCLYRTCRGVIKKYIY